MKEVSERTILIFTGIAIFVSLGSILLILAKVGMNIPIITGLQALQGTAFGEVNVTVAKTISITFESGFVQFGNGSLSPNSTAGWTPVNTSASANPNTFAEPGPLKIRNDGNEDVNLTINGSTASTLLAGTNPYYQWQGLAATGDNGCAGSNNITTSFTNMAVALSLVCWNLTYADSADAVNVSIFLWIPSDVSAGLKRDQVLEILAMEHPGG